MNLFDISGKKALVTGGSVGLGKAIVEGLHQANAEVVIMDVLPEVHQTAASLNNQGPIVHSLQVDLSQRDSLHQVFDQTLNIFDGQLDILVNNAGIITRNVVENYPLEEWDKVMEVNLTAVFELCQLAGRVMIKQGSGKIINIASMLSYFGGILVCAYAASKGGVAQLTKALGNEWASKGINVNAIAPGYMDTNLNTSLIEDQVRGRQILERIPAGRWGKPEDLVGAVIYLSSEASNYLSGAIIPVDGGYLSR